MDEIKLKQKLNLILENYDIKNQIFNSAYRFYSHNIFENNFTEEELDYIVNNLLEEYKNMKIPCQKKDDLLITDVGTFVLKRNYFIKNKINNKKEITLEEFKTIIMELLHIEKYKYGYHGNENIRYIQELFDAYQYYKLLKNIDYDIINRRFETSRYSFSLCLPLEVTNNPQRIVEIDKSNYKEFRYLYDYYCKFENNPIIKFYMAVTENNIQKKDIERFKKVLLRPFSNYYFNFTYSYLKDNYSDYLDDDYLIELYKIHYDKKILINDEKIFSLAQTLKNTSPLIKIKKDSEEIYLTYNHNYDLYKNIPFGNLKNNIQRTTLLPNSENFEDYFIFYNGLFTKMYKMYYSSYKKIIKEEDKNNLYDFMNTILFNPNNFISITRNTNFSVDEIRQLINIVKCYGEEAKAKFDEFYKKFCIQERQRVLSFHNYLVANKENKAAILNAIDKFGIKIDNVYTEILNNKFIESKLKQSILNIINIHFSDKLKVIDIMYILDEMLDREMTIDEILEEKQLDKKIFNKIYAKSLEENPILYEYISNSLTKNKRRGFKKLIKLGYSILRSNIRSLKEFNDKFPKHNFDEVLNGLKDTELFDKLLLKASNWSDYSYISDLETEEIKKK